MERVAVLRDSHVVRVGQRGRARHPVELRIDVDRRAVQVQDRAQDLIDVERRSVPIDGIADHLDNFADLVEEEEADCERTACGVHRNRLNIGPLPFITAVLERLHRDLDRRVGRWQQAGALACFAPLDRVEVCAGEFANEAHDILHVPGGADSVDPDVVRPVNRPQCGGNAARVEIEVQRDKGDAFATDDAKQVVRRHVALVVGRDAQLVGARRGLDCDHLRLGDRRHVEPDHRLACHRADVVVRVPAVIEIQNVGQRVVELATTVHREQRIQRIQHSTVAAHADHIRILTRVDGRIAGDGLHDDCVTALAGADVRGAVVGGLDREGVVAVAQLDVQHLEVRVNNAAGENAPADHGLVAHAEAGDRRRRQDADIIGRAVAVEEVQRIDLGGLSDPNVRVNRRVEVAVARRGNDQFARLLDHTIGRRHQSTGTEQLERRADRVAGRVRDDQLVPIHRRLEVVGEGGIDRQGQGHRDRIVCVALDHGVADSKLRVAISNPHGPDVSDHKLIVQRHRADVEFRPGVHKRNGVTRNERLILRANRIGQTGRKLANAIVSTDIKYVIVVAQRHKPCLAFIGCLDNLERGQRPLEVVNAAKLRLVGRAADRCAAKADVAVIKVDFEHRDPVSRLNPNPAVAEEVHDSLGCVSGERRDSRNDDLRAERCAGMFDVERVRGGR